jgi:AcrR family transcriptional regulator
MIHNMKRQESVNQARSYRSQLRAAQMEGTRQCIIEGLVRTLARGVGALSVPAVAREAGVSITTVYRYFRTKEELLRALAESYEAKLETWQLPRPHDPADWEPYLRQIFRRYEQMEPGLRAAMLTEVGNQARATWLPERLKLIEDALGPAFRELSPHDRARFCNVVLILTASATQRAFKDYLTISGEEAAEHVAWAIDQLMRALTVQAADER